MLDACLAEFDSCDGLIGVAARSDYQPVSVADQKIKKTGQPLVLQLIQTPDIVATLGASKRPDQWVVGFALETEDAYFQAVTKLHKKCCDLVVLNGPQAMNAEIHAVEIIDTAGQVVADFSDPKPARGQQRLVRTRSDRQGVHRHRQRQEFSFGTRLRSVRLPLVHYQASLLRSQRSDAQFRRLSL